MNNTALRAFIKRQTKQIYETHISGITIDEAEDSGTDVTGLSDDDVNDVDNAESEIDVDSKDDTADKKKDIYTYKSMITLFNAIRSGQSMKDKEVVASLKEAWDTLDEHHQKGLLSALAKIAKIVSKSESSSNDNDKQDVTSDDIAKAKGEPDSGDEGGSESVDKQAGSDKDFDETLYDKNEEDK